jgi:intein-encoded DNA endonuclease-like protein
MFTGTRSFWIEDYVSLSGNLKVGYEAIDASIIFPDNGGTISWEGEGTYNIEGLTTPLDISDDEFELDLSGSATAINGDTYTFETTSPLITKVDCIDDCIFIGGIFEVKSEVESDTTFTYGNLSKTYNLETTTTVSFDFGDGSVCDDKFNVAIKLEIESIDGNTSTVLYEEELGTEEYTCSALDTL